MHIATILLIALGLSMDAFAVSVATGLAARKLHIVHALRMAAFFGIFQALMPIVGWLAGLAVRGMISGLDHWVAFGLLSFVGCKMVYEAFTMESDGKKGEPHGLLALIGLSLATSMDAFAIGISLTVLNVTIIVPALVIGAVTFVLSLAGCYIGKQFGHFFEKGIEVLGGAILIAIGVLILLKHLHGQ
jgi:manganese efflux pump family protein